MLPCPIILNYSLEDGPLTVAFDIFISSTEGQDCLGWVKATDGRNCRLRVSRAMRLLGS